MTRALLNHTATLETAAAHGERSEKRWLLWTNPNMID